MRLPIQIQCIVFRIKDNVPEFLILKRNSERGGFWQSITGGVEECDKSMIDACRREVHEETGINHTSIIKEHQNIYLFQFSTINNEVSNDALWFTEYVYGFEVTTEAPIILNNKDYEHDEFKWCSFEDAIKLMKYEENKTSLKKLNEMIFKK